MSNILNFNGIVTENSYMQLIVSILNSSLFSGIIYSLCIVFDSLIPSKLKDKLVYLWRSKPGEKIFSNMLDGKVDERFTVEEAKKKYSEILSNLQSIKDKKEKKNYENSKWYEIYRQHEDETKVWVSQRDFLLCRDMSLMSIVILIIFIIFSLALDFITIKLMPIVYLLALYIITMLAANAKAKRFAYTVISCDIHCKVN